MVIVVLFEDACTTVDECVILSGGKDAMVADGVISFLFLPLACREIDEFPFLRCFLVGGSVGVMVGWSGGLGGGFPSMLAFFQSLHGWLRSQQEMQILKGKWLRRACQA